MARVSRVIAIGRHGGGGDGGGGDDDGEDADGDGDGANDDDPHTLNGGTIPSRVHNSRKRRTGRACEGARGRPRVR